MLFESISAFFTAVSECAKTRQASIEHKLELQSIKEDGRHEKAIKAANKAFDLLLPYLDDLPPDVKKEFKKYKRHFDNNLA